MSSRRVAKVAEVIREAVSTAILFELRDPRIQNVTVTGVDVTTDLRYAKVRVSVRGDERQANLCLHGLNSARGFLQSQLSDRIKTRYTPELRFVIDEGLKRSVEAHRILREVLPDEYADEQPADETSEGEINESNQSEAATSDELPTPEVEAGQDGSQPQPE